MPRRRSRRPPSVGIHREVVSEARRYLDEGLVISTATGFRSEAYAFRPRRCARDAFEALNATMDGGFAETIARDAETRQRVDTLTTSDGALATEMKATRAVAEAAPQMAVQAHPSGPAHRRSAHVKPHGGEQRHAAESGIQPTVLHDHRVVTGHPQAIGRLLRDGQTTDFRRHIQMQVHVAFRRYHHGCAMRRWAVRKIGGDDDASRLG